MNPYSVLGVSPKASLQNLGDTLKATKNISNEKYQELINSAMKDERYQDLIKSSSDESEVKKELVLDKLIEAQYQYLYETAVEFVKKKLPSDAAFEKIEQDMKKRQDLLKTAYETIKTKQKRDEYELIPEDEKKQLFEQFEQPENIVPMMSKKEMIQKQIKKILKEMKTRRGLSQEDLKHIEEENKRHMDSKNRFPKFTGSLFNWGVMMEYEELIKGRCLLNEMNENGERIFASSLGVLQYERILKGPTEEQPEGKYGKEVLIGINVLGITKLNADGEVIRNDIVVSRLNDVDSEEKKNFLRDVYFSDELIDQATQKNEGFMGNVIRGKDARHFEIQCNDFGDNDVISVLRLGNYQKGEFYSMRDERLWKKEDYTFGKIKEKLAKFQLKYMKAFPTPIQKKPDREMFQDSQEEKGEMDV